MTLNPMKSPAAFSGLCACAALCAASLLPIWTVADAYPQGVPNPHCVQYYPGNLFKAVRFSLNEIERSSPAALLDVYRTDIALALFIATASAIAGRLYYWKRWERGTP